MTIQIGGLKLGLNVMVLLLVSPVWLLKKHTIATISAKALLILLAYLLLSYIVAIAGPCTDKFTKLFFTAPVFLFLISVGLEIGWNASEDDWFNLQKIAALILLLAFAGFVVEMLFPGLFPDQAKYRINGTYSGILHEPSNVAFSLFPSVAILLLAEKQWLQRIGLLALLGLYIFSRSSTLIALTLGWFVYQSLRKGRFGKSLIIGFAVASLVALLAMIDYDTFLAPTVDRVGGVILGQGETANISSLVYLQGWQDAWANFQRTNGFGLGFNMMGCSPLPDVSAREILTRSLGFELNSEDGSFLFSKLTSEMGWICIASFLVLIWWWLSLEKEIRTSRADIRNQVIRVQTMLMVYFLISSVVRGGGYFNTVLLLLVVAVSGSVKWHNSHSRAQRNIGESKCA